MLKPFEGYFEDKMESEWGKFKYKLKGIIEDKNTEDASISGKEFVVVYFHPFTGIKNREWRAAKEIIVTECDLWDDDYILAAATMSGS